MKGDSHMYQESKAVIQQNIIQALYVKKVNSLPPNEKPIFYEDFVQICIIGKLELTIEKSVQEYANEVWNKKYVEEFVNEFSPIIMDKIKEQLNLPIVKLKESKTIKNEIMLPEECLNENLLLDLEKLSNCQKNKILERLKKEEFLQILQKEEFVKFHRRYGFSDRSCKTEVDKKYFLVDGYVKYYKLTEEQKEKFYNELDINVLHTYKLSGYNWGKEEDNEKAQESIVRRYKKNFNIYQERISATNQMICAEKDIKKRMIILAVYFSFLFELIALRIYIKQNCPKLVSEVDNIDPETIPEEIKLQITAYTTYNFIKQFYKQNPYCKTILSTDYTFKYLEHFINELADCLLPPDTMPNIDLGKISHKDVKPILENVDEATIKTMNVLEIIVKEADLAVVNLKPDILMENIIENLNLFTVDNLNEQLEIIEKCKKDNNESLESWKKFL